VLFLCFLLSNTTCTYHMLPLLFVIDLLLSPSPCVQRILRQKN
jgi:hypothetical protein